MAVIRKYRQIYILADYYFYKERGKNYQNLKKLRLERG